MEKINNIIFNLNPLPTWIYDSETWKILEVNKSAIEYYGYSRDEFLSLSWRDLSPTQEVPLIVTTPGIEKKEGNIYLGIFTHQKKDSSLIQIEIHGQNIDFNGCQCIIAVGQNVTKKVKEKQNHLIDSFHDRKMVEQTVKESEGNFKKIFEIASLGIIQVDPSNGQIILANTYYETITGYSLDELLKISFLDLTHPDDRERDWELFSKAAQGEIEYRNEKRYIKKDGSIVWVRIHLAFIHNEEGKPIKTVAICEDITARKGTELRLKDLSDNIPGVVFQYLYYPDGSDAMRYVSKGAEDIWGYSPEEVTENINLVWDQTKAGGDYNAVHQSIKYSVENKAKWSVRYRSIKPNGEKRVLQGLGTPDFMLDGTVLFNSVVLDITQEVKNEELLAQATALSRIGSWELDLVGNKLYWSDLVHELHETDPETFVPNLETAINFYREDFREMVNEKISVSGETGKNFDFEAVIITEKQQERWVRAMGNVDLVDGKFQRIYGSFQDINLQKILELQIREILESISDAFYGLDEKWNFTYFNKEAENLLQRRAEDVLGKNFWEEFSPAKGTEIEEKYRLVRDKGITETFDYWYPGDGKWYEINAYPSKDGISAFFKNIDNRRKTAEELQKAYEEKNNILESIGDAFFTMDRNFIVSYWNRSAEELLGVKREQLLGNNLWDIFPDAVALPSYTYYHKVMETRQPAAFEDYFGKWLEINAYPSEEGITVFFRDITEKKEANERILKAFEEKNRILESIGDAFFAVDKNDIVTYWNKEAEIVLNKNRSEIVGERLWEKYPDLVDSDFYLNYHRALETRKNVNFEAYNPNVKKWFEVTAYPSEEGLSVYFKDVTLRKETDNRLIKANERFEIVTEATNDAIWDFDSLNNHLFWGKGFHTLFGYDPDEIDPTFDLLVSLIHEDDRARIIKEVGKYMTEPHLKVWYQEYRFRKKDNSYAFVIDRATFIRNSEGQVERVIGAMNDITERKNFEQQLLELNESLKKHAHELEISNEELEQFAFIASHDLQEPLRMVSSFMDQLRRKYEDQLDEKAKQYIYYATDGAKRMKKIILDLLEYSRAGKFIDAKEMVDLNELVENFIILRRKVIDEKSVEINSKKLPVIEFYKAPFTQTLHCLLDNAINYSQADQTPKISISVEDIGKFWEVKVTDNGIGIDAQFHNKIFIIFQRLHNRERYKGTGIGLSIVKKNVESWGGEIGLESTPGEGSTFHFTVPK